MATGFIHLKSPYFEVDQGLLNINSVGSGQLASLSGQGEDRAVWVHGEGGAGEDGMLPEMGGRS